MKYILIYAALLSLLDFILMGVDKSRAKRRVRRIPEASLLLVAVIGGGLGGLLGMYFFRHKTRHAAFAVGLPVIVLLQIICAWLAYTFLR